MSTYNLLDADYITVKENLDELIMCIANKDLMKRKLGIGELISNKDLNFFLYAYDFLSNRYCSYVEVNECFLSKLNSLIYKYK
mgnify:CR=1 FL=1